MFDNIFVERLWRTVKYEEIHVKEYEDVDQPRRGIGGHFRFHNHERLRQALGRGTPAEVHFGDEKATSQITANSVYDSLQLVGV